MTRRLASAALGGLLVVTGLAGCADDPVAVRDAEARTIEPLDAGLPLFLSGLRVDEEDIAATLEAGERPYLEAMGLWSLREEDDLLQATLQIGRFSDDVDPADEEFQDRIVTNIGPGARTLRMGEQTVHVTGGDRQTLSIWFSGEHLFILSTRDGYGGGRRLLRAVLEIEP